MAFCKRCTLTGKHRAVVRLAFVTTLPAPSGRINQGKLLHDGIDVLRDNAPGLFQARKQELFAGSEFLAQAKVNARSNRGCRAALQNTLQINILFRHFHNQAGKVHVVGSQHLEYFGNHDEKRIAHGDVSRPERVFFFHLSLSLLLILHAMYGELDLA